MHLLILGGTRDERLRAACAAEDNAVVRLDAATLPFVRAHDVPLPPPPRTIVLHDAERAFPNRQTGAARLVLTQSAYLMQTWLDALAPGDRIVATADSAALEACAPEALQARGPWSAFTTERLDRARRGGSARDANDARENDLLASAASAPVNGTSRQLAAAYASADPAERLRRCADATALDPESAAAWLALASAYREHQDLRARDALERAAALAADWAAVHYETGKLWLALEELPRARDAFARAADLMPTFSAASSNLGATLGELGDPHGALAAFERALAHDRRNHTLLSNVGVVLRELGRLDESAAALREVVALAPAFVFGHYNLGHTLFLAGRPEEAVAAYEEGQRRDPQKNPRQACRLAMARLAAGDAAGAEHDLWGAAASAPAEERGDLLLEAYETAHALFAARAELTAHKPLLDRLAAEIAKSE